MTQEQFDALVARLEVAARRSPGIYQAKVVLLACLGQAYVVTVLMLVFVLFLFLLAAVLSLKLVLLKFAIILGGFLWVIVKALWVRIEPPQGHRVTRRECPELFETIEALRRRLRAPRFHRVLVTGEFNAGVVQAPRLGLLGWYRNYLLIGLPLMKSLTVEQFNAVLAHEFGHLAKGHGRLSNWIYRLRLRWARLIAALEHTESRGGFLFRPFLGRFVPWFNAWSFPLARANEYEADATAARLTSPAAAAGALTAVNVIGSFLNERFWPDIHGQADEQPQPRFAPYGDMGRHIETGIDADSARAWLARSMAERTTSADTHPALADRLQAIGAPPCLALPEPGAAADRLLGDALPEITQTFDRSWRENIGSAWGQRFREVQVQRHRLAELNATHERGEPLDPQDAYERALLTESAGKDADDALAQLRELHGRAPDSAVVCFALGARLVARNDDAGIPLLEHAMSLDEDAIVRASEVLRDHHWRNGREDEAHAWHERLVARAELEQAAAKEREVVTLKDRLEPHGMPEEQAAALREQLRAVKGVKRAYYVKKLVRHLPHRRCFVLGYRCTGLVGLYRRKRVMEVLDRIRKTVTFPHETIIINVEGENYRFGRRFRRMRGARVL